MTKCCVEWCIALVDEDSELCVVHRMHPYWHGPTLENEPEDDEDDDDDEYDEEDDEDDDDDEEESAETD